MVHIEFIGYATPKQHEDFLKDVNNWEYKYKGKVRQGVIKPYVSEVKLYDVRIPKEHVGEFIRDINGIVFNEKINFWQYRKQGVPLLGWIIKLLRLVTPLKTPDKKYGERKYKPKHWFNAAVLGELTDTEQDTVGGRREVL